MAPFLSAADEVVVQDQTENSLFVIEQPPRLRDLTAWSRSHSSFTKEESRLPQRFR
jgi:hypothetical protein